MKKFSVITLSILFLCCMATLATAYRTGGQFAGDNIANPDRYSTDFAPKASKTVALGTKGGYTNVTVSGNTAYKFYFQKVSDKSAVIGNVRFGGYSSGYGTTGNNFASSGEKFTLGEGVKVLGFSNYSGPAAQVTILTQ